MVEPLQRVRSLLTRSVPDGDDSPSTASETDPDPDPPTEGGRLESGEYVYECPGCNEVYLNEKPHRCSSCGEKTAPVGGDGG